MRLGVFLMVMLSGCGGGRVRPIEREAPLETVAEAPVTAEPPASEPCWLVWLTEGARTTSREVCETTGVQAESDGLRMWIDGHAVMVVEREISVTGARCTDSGDDSVADPARTFTARALDAVGVDGTVNLLPLPDYGAPEALEDRIELLGSLGPYLAVRRFTSEYDACAAEGLEVESVTWIDVRTGEALSTSPTAGEQALIDELAAEAGDARASAVRGRLANGRAVGRRRAPRMDEGFLSPRGLLPVRQPGRWSLVRELVLVVEEQDAWRFDMAVEDLPALGAHLQVPSAVDALLRAHPDASAAGWTEGG